LPETKPTRAGRERARAHAELFLYAGAMRPCSETKKGPGIARDCKNGMAGEAAGHKSRLTCTDVHDLYIKFTSQTFNPQLKLGDLLQVIS